MEKLRTAIPVISIVFYLIGLLWLLIWAEQFETPGSFPDQDLGEIVPAGPIFTIALAATIHYLASLRNRIAWLESRLLDHLEQTGDKP
ncbi:MAG: hypothetical protein ACLFUJ_13750 [Phycisphaerae bacterium]